MGGAAVALALLFVACGGGRWEALTEVEKQAFGLNGVPMTSHLVEVETRVGDRAPYVLSWHYVEAGEGEPVVLLHGLPESWYSWHYQLEALAADYRLIAIDLKGYGRSDKSEGDYTASNVAEEVLVLLNAIGLERFNLVSHDWGTLVGDYLAGRHPDRILRYVRMQAPLLKVDPRNHPQFALFRDQQLVTRLMEDAERFVRSVYSSRTVQPILEEDMRRIIEEFSREGVAEAVPRYFRDFGSLGEGGLEGRAALFAAMDFPVLLLQADRDPAQPPSYFEDATRLFPDAELQWVENSGHFSELEQPQAVTQAIRAFFSR